VDVYLVTHPSAVVDNPLGKVPGSVAVGEDICNELSWSIIAKTDRISAADGQQIDHQTAACCTAA